MVLSIPIPKTMVLALEVPFFFINEGWPMLPLDMANIGHPRYFLYKFIIRLTRANIGHQTKF
jgi:hypothetical protein